MNYSRPIRHRQPRLKFVAETPIGSSRYNARLTKEERNTLKRKIRTLHARGIRRKEMLTRCRATIRKPITYAQLDNLRQELGLQNYRRRPSDSTHLSVINDSSYVPQNATDFDEDMDSESESMGVSTVNYSSKGSGTVMDQVHIEAVNDDMDIDLDTTQDRGDAPSPSLRLLSVTPPEFHALSEDDSMPDDGTTSDHDPKTPRDSLDFGYMFPTFMLNEANTESASKSEGDCVLSTDAATSILIDDREPPPSALQVNEMHPQDDTRIASFQLRYDAVLSDPVFEAWHDEAQFAACVTEYHPTSEALDMYNMAMKQSQGQLANTAMINKTANFLFILRAFDEAFDLYLLIYQGFRNFGDNRDPPHPQMVLAAINCARSARDARHIEIGSAIIEMTRQQLLQYYGFDSIKFTETWRYLTALQCEWPGYHTRPFSQVYIHWIFLVTLQSRREKMDDAARFSKTAIVSETERQKDLAYWAATALMLGLSNPESPPEIVPDYYLSFWRDRAMQHFCECEVTRLSILSALARLSSFIKEHSDLLDRLFRMFRKPAEQGAGQFAQALTCLFLSLGGHEDPIYNRRQNNKSGHDGFPCDFNGHLTAILPFSLADWVESHGRSRLSLLTRGPRLRIAGQFQLAIKHFTQKICSSTLNYEEIVISIIDRLAPAKDKHEKHLEGVRISRHVLRCTALGVAGLTPPPDFRDVLAGLESTPDGVPETIPEFNATYTPGAGGTASTSNLSVLAPSYRSSKSSGLQSFKSVVSRAKSGSVSTHSAQSAGRSSSRSSWSFRQVTGIAPVPESPRNSRSSGSSDASLTGWEPPGAETTLEPDRMIIDEA